MTAQRFVGANSREAMNRVRLVLGDDALILSSRMTDEGVEIMARADAAPVPAPACAPADERPVPVSAHMAAAAYARQTAAFESPRPRLAATSTATSTTTPAAPITAPSATVAVPPPLSPAMDFAALGERLLKEIHDMRQLIDPRQAPANQARDSRPALLQWLLDAGFSARLSEEILGAAPLPLPEAQLTAQRQQYWLAHRLDSRLNRLDDEDALFADSGIIALVGPTGVGKTTTTAKLAARYVMRHGASQVALVTTDSFRVGAHEQLAIYARLLGVELHTLSPAAPLDQLLVSLAAKRLVIIDTVGMSQRDQRLLTQINQLGASTRSLRLMLVLNAASHGDTLEEVLHTYRQAAQAASVRLDDCIISKCDEAVRLGPALDIVIRHGLRLNYLSVGQQVPEDLQLPGETDLFGQALDVSRPSLFASRPAHAPGQRLDALVRGLVGQSRQILALRDQLSQGIPGFARLLEAWPLIDQPLALQHRQWAERFAGLADDEPASPGGVLLWGSARPGSGATWHMPLLSTDGNGHLHARPWLAHRLPVGAPARLAWSQPRWPGHRHVWPACPDRASLTALDQASLPWLAAVKGGQRVVHHGERQRLDTLTGQAADFGWRELRHRGRRIRLSLRHLPVSLATDHDTPLRAWAGTLQDSHGGQCLGQRWWLADDSQGRQQQADDIILQLSHDELPALTARCWRQLADTQRHLNAELRLYLASGLAAAAVRLTNASDDPAFLARAQLLELLPKKRAASAGALLDGLLQLLAACTAFSHMDSAQAS